MSLTRVFRGSLGSLSSVLGHELWCIISGVIHYWSWSFGGLRCQGLFVCVSGSLMYLWVWVTFDLGLESCSGPQEGKQSGAIYVDGGGMDGMGCGGTWRARMLQADLSIVCHCMYLSFPFLRSSWCLKCLICLLISFLVTISDEFYVFDHR